MVAKMALKIFTDADEAVKDVFDGAIITISGCSGVGLPLELVHALIRKKVQNLTVITWAFGLSNMLIKNGCVKKIITSWPQLKFDRMPMNTVDLAKNVLGEKDIEVELVNQVTMVERLRAGTSGVGAFYTPVSAGTELANGKETRVINGVEHVLEYSIKPDFAFCRVSTADTMGNVTYDRMFKNINHELITAGQTTIVQADNIVEPGTFEPFTSGCFVSRLIKTKSVQPAFRIQNLSDHDSECNNIGQRIAQDIPDNSLINLGVGIPWYAANYIDHNKNIIIHTDGLYGVKSVVPDSAPETYCRAPTNGAVDLIPGGHAITFGDSFAVIMRGLVDIAVVGAYQVDATGAFAGWKIPNSDRPPAVGASMELANYAKQVWISMKHFDSAGNCKILKESTYPITARGVVKRIYTELCTLEVTDQGLRVIDIIGNMSHDELEQRSNMKFLPRYD